MPMAQLLTFLGHSKLETAHIYAESPAGMIKESYRRALAGERVRGCGEVRRIKPSTRSLGLRATSTMG